MSTFLMNIPDRRSAAKYIANLASTGAHLFHTEDLAHLLAIRNPNTLRVTLYRLTEAHILYRIQRGLYSILPLQRLDPLLLGSTLLHRYCYLTTESVLWNEGYILQSLDAITFASDVSRRFTVAGHRFVSHRLHPRFLHHPLGITRKGEVLRANVERAIADMLYVNPRYHFDHPVDWATIRAVQGEIGYPLTPYRYVDPSPA